MTTKTKKRAGGNVGEFAGANAAVQEEGGEERQETFFDQLRDDDYVRIHRMDDFDKRWVYHGRLAMHEANEEYVGRAIGGGYYRVQLLSKANTDGRQYKIEGTRTFKLPGKYTPPASLLGDTPAGTTPDGQQQQKVEVGTIDGMNPNAALNHALVASVIDLLKTMREPSKQQPVNWGELVKGAVDLATLFKREKPDMSPLDMLKMVKELIPAATPQPATPASNAITDAVKGLKELMGLKDIVEGKEAPADPETAMWGTAMKALDVLAARKGEAPAPSSSQAPAPQIASNTPKWKVLLLARRNTLVQAASFGLAPDTAAETALTFLPPQMHGVLTEFLALPDHVAITMQTIPELQEFKQWTEEFFKELHAQFMGGEDAEKTEASDVGES